MRTAQGLLSVIIAFNMTERDFGEDKVVGFRSSHGMHETWGEQNLSLFHVYTHVLCDAISAQKMAYKRRSQTQRCGPDHIYATRGECLLSSQKCPKCEVDHLTCSPNAHEL